MTHRWNSRYTMSCSSSYQKTQQNHVACCSSWVWVADFRSVVRSLCRRFDARTTTSMFPSIPLELDRRRRGEILSEINVAWELICQIYMHFVWIVLQRFTRSAALCRCCNFTSMRFKLTPFGLASAITSSLRAMKMILVLHTYPVFRSFYGALRFFVVNFFHG